MSNELDAILFTPPKGDSREDWRERAFLAEENLSAALMQRDEIDAALASSRAEVERLRPVADEMRKIRDLAFRFGFLGDRPEVVEFIYRIHTLAAAAVDTYESQEGTG